jgi:hypothetical protein
MVLNDVVIYDIIGKKIIENIILSEANVASRIYSCGFKIDKSIFAIGGLSSSGKLLNTVTEIDYFKKIA